MSRHVKSRSGCRVCKAKRLKCDETVPACRNCVNRGIACPGYRQVLRWSTKYEHPTVAKPAAGPTGASSRPACSTAGAGATASFTQFSELASAVAQSIKPEAKPSQSPAPPAAATPAQAPDSTLFDSQGPGPGPTPRIKTEKQPVEQLEQVPEAPPPQPPSYEPDPHAHHPLAPPPLFLSSPMMAEALDTAPPPFSIATTAAWTLLSPTIASLALPQGDSMASTSVYREDWSLVLDDSSMGAMERFVDVVEVGDEEDNDVGVVHDTRVPEADEDSSEFTLELWQPGPLDARRQQQQQSLLSPIRDLNLHGTSLVDLWFRSVCGVWAAMDSPTNPFRRLFSSLWSSNEAVYFSMQTMAAASLPRRSPSIGEIVKFAPQMSTQALIRELQDLFGQSSPSVYGPSASVRAGTGGVGSVGVGGLGSPQFPAGLLASLFCMSSSLSWIDARQLGIQYLRNARSVIDLLDLRAAQLTSEDRELLEFFRGCLLYEEMLRSIVSDDQEDIRALLDWQPPVHKTKTTASATKDTAAADMAGRIPGEGTVVSLELHAWVGVPIVLIGLFGKVMALCRRSRKAWRQTARATYELLCQAMLDIHEAKALEETLLSIDIPGVTNQGIDHPSASSFASSASSASSSSISSCPDDQLRSHIYKAAEAFRLSSLLQLYQTFPDLVTPHQQRAAMELAGVTTTPAASQAPTSSKQATGVDNTAIDTATSTTLVAQMTAPALQPATAETASAWLLPLAVHVADLVSVIPSDSPMRCLQPLLCLCAGSALREAGPDADGFGAVSNSVVRQARDSMSQRLAQLEQNLPPRPITVARQLLETVWLTYDTEVPPKRSHWLDIMAETSFESVFG